jgi:Leucine-rich repeat (LRR) protein
MANEKAQEYLNSKYPTRISRFEISSLDIENNNLSGPLNLSEFVNLRNLYCSHNKITFLDLTGCQKLKNLACEHNELTEILTSPLSELSSIYCNDNYLTELNLSPATQKSLIFLKVNDNNFPRQNIDIFSGYVDLKSLQIGNFTFSGLSSYNKKNELECENNNENLKSKKAQGIYNRFYGSLSSLIELKKLVKLDIRGTEVTFNTDDFESLSSRIQSFLYSREKLSESQIEFIDSLILKRVLELDRYRKEEVVLDFESFGLNETGYYLDLEKYVENGCIDLGKYTKLEELNLSDNNLTSLEIFNITNNLKLKKLDVSFNEKLTNSAVSNLPRNLTSLNLSKNEALTNQLSDFSHLVNLTELDISFTNISGSLLALVNCSNLKKLDIRGTKINEGLEYLPFSLEKFFYKESPLEKELSSYPSFHSLMKILGLNFEFPLYFFRE